MTRECKYKWQKVAAVAVVVVVVRRSRRATMQQAVRMMELVESLAFQKGSLRVKMGAKMAMAATTSNITDDDREEELEKKLAEGTLCYHMRMG